MSKTPNYDKARANLLAWPGTSNWLRKAIQELEQCDPVDAANDAEALHLFMHNRCAELLGGKLDLEFYNHVEDGVF